MKKLFKSRHTNEEMSLQITSMADIFTILLVFLLKSYSTSALAIQPSKGLALPQAQAEEQAVEALKIMVSESSIEVEGQPVATLDHFAFDAKDLQNGASQTLNQALEKERKRQLLIAQANSDVKVDSKIIVVADQHVPYSTLKTVLASAALQGYTDFKLAVAKAE
jgi:biopolymer transport protein ExbD